MRVRTVLLAALCATALAWCPRARALDPSLDIGQYAHTAWKIRDGFARGTISTIAQTPDGYLWLGGEFGLLRFDGVRPVPWQPPEGQSLPGNGVRNLLAARDGTLWIATNPGFASLKDGKLTSYPQFDEIYIHGLIEDREGTIWASTGNPTSTARLCALRSGRGECSGDDGAFGRFMGSLLQDRRGQLWGAALNGVWRLRPGPPKFISLADPVSGSLQVLAEGDDGALLVNTQAGIRRLVDGKVVEPALRDERLPTASSFLRDRHGGLWVGTTTGLVHFHEGHTDVFTRSDGLSGTVVHRLFEDREGNVWVTTSDGLDRFREFAAPRLSESQGLASGLISTVVSSRDGSVWFNSLNGLHRWSNGQVTVYRRRPERPSSPLAPAQAAASQPLAVHEVVGALPDRGIGAMLQDKRGRLWIGSQAGVGYLENDRFVAIDGVPGGYIDAIDEDQAGNLWLTHREIGLIRLSANRVAQRIAWDRLGRRGPAHRLATDPSQGGLWLGFLQGGIVHVVDGQVRASYEAKDGLSKGRVAHFRTARDGALWVASAGGLSRLKNGRIATLTSANGLPCDAVDWMTEDDSAGSPGSPDSYWLYTGCGIVRIARSELDAWATAVDQDRDAKQTIQATVFDNSDGVRSSAIISSYSPHFAKSPDGKLWFAGHDGLGVIDPRHLPHNALAPPVHVEQIVADRKAYDVGSAAARPVRLPPLVRDVQIDYTALSLVAPEKMRFRHRLEGWDRDWVDAGTRRQAFYADLPPGDYRFRVIAANNSGVWNEDGATLAISVEPAYYQSAWFRVLAAAAMVAAAWGAYRWRVRSLAARLHAVQQENRERLRAEEALRQSEERYALAVAGSSEGIFDWDLAQDRVYVAHRTQQLLGLQPGDPWRPRKEWRRLLPLDPDDETRLRSALKAHLCGRTTDYDMEFRLLLPAGTRWFHQRGVALRDASGKVYRMAGSITDITERKLDQEERLQLEERLRQAQRLEAMGTLAGGIAHDFNNILGAILGYGEMALRDTTKGTRLRRDVDSIMTAGERGRALVEQILAFSRSSTSARVAVDVERVVREALDHLTASLPPDVTVVPRLRAGHAAVLGDPTQVHQVLMNLATNAFQAMPSGGTLRLLLEPVLLDAPRVVTTGTVKAGQYVVLEVADSGVGMSPDIVDRIFDPFFTTKEVGVGTGLGLSLVHGIVTELGGAINVASVTGTGSVFTVYLPRAGDAPEFSQSEVPSTPLGNNERVLVVDDEEALMRIATETLEEFGYQAVGFTSSLAALEAFRADPFGFDALVTDERMPGMTGSALIREVRAVHATIPALLVSGFMGAAASSAARETGADEVLKKPLSARDLAASLARVLGKARAGAS